ncbi:MAG: ABC transporter permease [Bacteroidales bacterium]|nr:ABC transporter permease [Bacteroidales bacterium]
MAGIAIGIIVMLVSVAVVIGFKSEVRNKVIGFGSHIQISNLDDARSYEMRPVVVNDSLLAELSDYKQVKHIQRFSTKPGIIKTDSTFQGMVLKGVGPEFDPTFMKEHLVAGIVPHFSDTLSTNQVLISKAIADKLGLKLGDKIYTYYINDNVRARRLTIKGIYQTNFAEYDKIFLITDIYTVNHLNGWKKDQYGGIELTIRDYDLLNKTTYDIASNIDKMKDKYGGVYYVRNIVQLNPQLFAWLGLLDMNVWVILILMIGIAGFTMVSGLLIIIIERTNMIGLLKALGTNNYTVRRIFLWLSVFIIGKGILIGDIIAVALIYLQGHFKIIKLNPATYYVDTVPVSFNVLIFIIINVCSFLVSLMMLLGPSYLISKIHPANSMRYE